MRIYYIFREKGTRHATQGHVNFALVSANAFCSPIQGEILKLGPVRPQVITGKAVPFPGSHRGPEVTAFISFVKGPRKRLLEIDLLPKGTGEEVWGLSLQTWGREPGRE